MGGECMHPYPLQKASPYLRALGVECDGEARVEALVLLVLLRSLPAVVHRVAVVLVGAVAEVHPGDVHASIDHVVEELGRLRHGPDGADDTGEARPPGAAEDVEPAQEVDVGRGESGQLLAGRDIALGEDGLEQKGSEVKSWIS